MPFTENEHLECRRLHTAIYSQQLKLYRLREGDHSTLARNYNETGPNPMVGVPICDTMCEVKVSKCVDTGYCRCILNKMCDFQDYEASEKRELKIFTFAKSGIPANQDEF